MVKHVEIRVSGEVQGVNYRYSTREKARELGLKGFVRNEPNGDVYIEVEGEPERVEKLVEWCTKGPPRAVVEKVDLKESQPKNYQGFEIER